MGTEKQNRYESLQKEHQQLYQRLCDASKRIHEIGEVLRYADVEERAALIKERKGLQAEVADMPDELAEQKWQVMMAQFEMMKDGYDDIPLYKDWSIRDEAVIERINFARQWKINLNDRETWLPVAQAEADQVRAHAVRLSKSHIEGTFGQEYIKSEPMW